jgi:hypothetical protein
MMECYVRRSLRHMGVTERAWLMILKGALVNQWELALMVAIILIIVVDPLPSKVSRCCSVCPSLLVTIKAKLIKRLNGTHTHGKKDG